jgi:hypothetical protein
MGLQQDLLQAWAQGRGQAMAHLPMATRATTRHQQALAILGHRREGKEHSTEPSQAGRQAVGVVAWTTGRATGHLTPI